MSRLKVCHAASSYLSHNRAAAAYRELMAEHCELVPIERGTEADLVVLHFEPHQYDVIYRTYPALASKYVVAYAVWEAVGLPDEYKQGCSLVQEIWTCSRFCQASFSAVHSNVHYLPHLIERDTSCTADDDAAIRREIDWREDAIYFLSIAKLWDTRKNLKALVRVFQRIASRMPRARLILKVSAADRDAIIDDPRIVWLTGELPDGVINALYRLTHVYVSPHHAEGWGLTLSDAMLFGKPVIATGYSGNLEFMREENSYLLGYTEEPIRAEDCHNRFTSEMKWAYPDEQALEDTLFRLYDTVHTDEVAAAVRQASIDIQRFDRAALRAYITERVAGLRSHSGFVKS